MKTSILVVDDEQAFLDSVVRVLRLEGYRLVTAVVDPTRVEGLLETNAFDAALLDISMPGMDGIEVLRLIKERSPETECVMVTANENIPTVIRAVRSGAYDYLVKPITPDQLNHALGRALERKRLIESLMLTKSLKVEQTLDNPDAFDEIVTCDDSVLRLLHEAELHAASNIPVLITGETGVGKELLARAIHQASRRSKGPFVAVNMLSLSPNLFESEFFGHRKGAFTGADREKPGYLIKASRGTLFLDEIGDLSLEIQGKLLRILQEGEYSPVGDTRVIPLDVRFVAATNQDLQKLVGLKRFRKDLFYRLQFAHLQIPPLRNRREDLALLAKHFVSCAGRSRERYHAAQISTESMQMLKSHDWPGNIRELKGVIEAATNLAEGGRIEPRHLKLPKPTARKKPVEHESPGHDLEPLAEVERRHIISVYQAACKNKSKTARILGIGLQTLHRKLKAFDL